MTCNRLFRLGSDCAFGTVAVSEKRIVGVVGLSLRDKAGPVDVRGLYPGFHRGSPGSTAFNSSSYCRVGKQIHRNG